MKGFLRRLRGIIGTGLTWAVGWGAAFGILNVALTAVRGVPFLQFGVAVLAGAVYGFIAGGAFAVILSITERRRTLDELSLGRVALWGAIGGVALVLFAVPRMLGAGLEFGQIVSSLVARLPIVGLLGAGFSSGSVAIARRKGEKMLEGDDEPLRALEGE